MGVPVLRREVRWSHVHTDVPYACLCPQHIDSRHVVRAVGLFHGVDSVQVVLEPCLGGDLMDRMVARKKTGWFPAVQVFFSLPVSAIADGTTPTAWQPRGAWTGPGCASATVRGATATWGP